MSVVIPLVINKGQHPEHNTLTYDQEESLTQINCSVRLQRPLHQHYPIMDNISSGGQVTGKMTNNRNSINMPLLNIDKVDVAY
jgi:hypothetical protein